MQFNWARFAFVCGVVLLPSAAFAAPIGILNFMGDVSVGMTTIAFTSGMGANTFEISSTQEGAFVGLEGDTGNIMDLDSSVQPVGVPFTFANFMTFPTAPGLSFQLEFIEPGVFSSATCGGPAVAGQTCTPFPSSPFNLTNVTPTSSTVSFVVRGTAFDSTGGAPFIGVFTSQFSDQNFQGLLADLETAGSVDASYSANFTTVPEPGTLSMVLGALTMVAFTLARRRLPSRQQKRDRP